MANEKLDNLDNDKIQRQRAAEIAALGYPLTPSTARTIDWEEVEANRRAIPAGAFGGGEFGDSASTIISYEIAESKKRAYIARLQALPVVEADDMPVIPE